MAIDQIQAEGWEGELARVVEGVYAELPASSDDEVVPDEVAVRLHILDADADKYATPSMEAPVSVIAARAAMDATVLAMHMFGELEAPERPTHLTIDSLRKVVSMQPSLLVSDAEEGVAACFRRGYLELDDANAVTFAS